MSELGNFTNWTIGWGALDMHDFILTATSIYPGVDKRLETNQRKHLARNTDCAI